AEASDWLASLYFSRGSHFWLRLLTRFPLSSPSLSPTNVRLASHIPASGRENHQNAGPAAWVRDGPVDVLSDYTHPDALPLLPAKTARCERRRASLAGL